MKTKPTNNPSLMECHYRLQIPKIKLKKPLKPTKKNLKSKKTVAAGHTTKK